MIKKRELKEKERGKRLGSLRMFSQVKPKAFFFVDSSFSNLSATQRQDVRLQVGKELRVLKSESSQDTMKQTSKYTVLALLPLVIMSCLVPVTHGSVQYENELTSVVNWVIDGDTFNVTAGETIRLADIDAPELNHAGYVAAKSLLISLVYNKTVYLDIDDISRTDPYGRLVCVVFVDYNSTHVKNVNKALLNEGVVTLFDHSNNEFNPSTWTLYVSRTMIVPEFSSTVILAVLLPAFTLLRILFTRRVRA